MQDIELLQFVHETAVMGIEGLKSVRDSVRDDNLSRAMDAQADEYRRIAASSGILLQKRGCKPKDPSLLAKLSSEVSSAAKTMTDSSASNIAEIIIQGNNMGITKGTRNLNDYAGEDGGVRRLAEKLLETEKANVEQMKQFL